VKIVTVSTQVEIPRIPNFLRTAAGMLPLTAFSDEGLREIGEQWIENLLERRKEQAEDSKNNDI